MDPQRRVRICAYVSSAMIVSMAKTCVCSNLLGKDQRTCRCPAGSDPRLEKSLGRQFPKIRLLLLVTDHSDSCYLRMFNWLKIRELLGPETYGRLAAAYHADNLSLKSLSMELSERLRGRLFHIEVGLVLGYELRKYDRITIPLSAERVVEVTRLTVADNMHSLLGLIDSIARSQFAKATPHHVPRSQNASRNLWNRDRLFVDAPRLELENKHLPLALPEDASFSDRVSRAPLAPLQTSLRSAASEPKVEVKTEPQHPRQAKLERFFEPKPAAPLTSEHATKAAKAEQREPEAGLRR